MTPLLGLVTVLLALTGATCPPQVVRTYPDERAVQKPGQRIGADLDLTVPPGADLAALRLLVDGEDVTSRASVVATRDRPPSRVSISHSEVRLAAGFHRAEIQLQSRDGRTLSCAWSFVSEP